MKKRQKMITLEKKRYIINSYFIGGEKINDVLERIVVSKAQDKMRIIFHQKLKAHNQGGILDDEK